MATLRAACLTLIATSVLAASAYAQADSRPLDLKLSPSAVPPEKGFGGSSLAAAPVATTAPAVDTQAIPVAVASTGAVTAAGATVGAGALAVANPNAADACDDTTYNKPQVHGSVSTGVVAGNHVSGNYQEGTVNISKPMGDCEHPKGNLNISISAGQGRFGFHGNH